jgi:transposase
LVSRGITAAVKKDLAKAAGRAEMVKVLDGLEREEADCLAECLGMYEKRLAALEGQMDEEAAGDDEIECLQTAPGADRFENGGQVSNYPGLVPKVYMSGDTVRYGRITKQGERVRAGLAGPGGASSDEIKGQGSGEGAV